MQLTAELTFMPDNVKLYGIVGQINSVAAIIQLTTMPSNPWLIQTGRTVAMLAAAENYPSKFQWIATIQNYDKGFVYVTLEPAVQKRQRRENERVPCDTPVTYRAYRKDTFGPWQRGHVIDVGATGLCLELPTHLRFPPEVELHFSMPRKSMAFTGTIRVSTDEGTAFLSGDGQELLTARAKPKHGRFLENGSTRVGLHFSAIAPEDKRVIELYVADTIVG